MMAEPYDKNVNKMMDDFDVDSFIPEVTPLELHNQLQDAVSDYLDAQKRCNQVTTMNKSLTDTNVELQEQVSKLQAENHDAYKELIYVKSFWLVRVLLKFSKALNSLPKLRIEW